VPAVQKSVACSAAAASAERGPQAGEGPIAR
jgi:hypothetical protein